MYESDRAAREAPGPIVPLQWPSANWEVIVVRRKSFSLVVLSILALWTLVALGAGPQQQGGKLPPQPFFSDYFSGHVFVQGLPAPAGLSLVACINDCQGMFESKSVAVQPGGAYNILEVNPEDQLLRGRPVSFYLVNEHGRIKAGETAVFEGAYSLNRLNLTFDQPLPQPLPPPALPQVGDPVLPQLPKLALGLGFAAVVAGVALLLAGRRRAY